MNALFLTLFVSAGLTVLAVILYMQSVKSKTHDHVDRLAILPLMEDESAVIVKSEKSHKSQSTAVNIDECDESSDVS